MFFNEVYYTFNFYQYLSDLLLLVALFPLCIFFALDSLYPPPCFSEFLKDEPSRDVSLMTFYNQ